MHLKAIENSSMRKNTAEKLNATLPFLIFSPLAFLFLFGNFDFF
jgi:hypothetical protein